MTLLLASIAGVSLLVGGIGIMNIMLVSVTERTREIGIRMAVGARSNVVQNQFLIESVVLGLVGGAAGIALGVGISLLLSGVFNWPTLVSPWSVVVSAVFSMGSECSSATTPPSGRQRWTRLRRCASSSAGPCRRC